MLGKRFSKQLKRLLTNLLLFPVFMGLSVDGDPPADPPPADPPSDPPPADPPVDPPADDAPTYESLSAQAKEIADKAEELRLSKLSPEEKAAEEAAKKASEVPEEYADFTVGDGQQLDTELLADFKPLAKELGLSQEKAQKLVDLYGAKVIPQMLQRQTDAWNQQLETWKEAAKSDKEIGGDKFNASVSDAQRVINTLGTPELKQLFDQYGIGNNPELIRVFSRMAKHMKEDGLEMGGSTHQGNVAKKFYPNMAD